MKGGSAFLLLATHQTQAREAHHREFLAGAAQRAPRQAGDLLDRFSGGKEIGDAKGGSPGGTADRLQERSSFHVDLQIYN